MNKKGKINPKTGMREIPEEKPKRPRGRPKSTEEGKGRRAKHIFIVKEAPKKEKKAKPPKEKKEPKVYAEGEERKKGGRPKKVYTPEELIEKDEREKRRLENTVANRSKEFVQPWCETVLKFRNKVDAYFDTGANTYTLKKGDEEVTQKLYTWTGLAYFLGFSSRESLNKFGKRPEFKEIVEKAKLVVERTYEEKLQSTNPTGAIFALKNFGWVDTTKTDLNVTINPLEKLLKSAAKRQLPPNITMVDEQ